MTDELAAYYHAPGDFPSGGTLVATSTDRSFLAELRGFGEAQLVVQNDSTVQPAAGGVVGWKVRGTQAFASLCQSMTRVSIDSGEEANEKTTWDMPGHLAVYKQGVIGPPGGVGRSPVVQSFAYNYTHRDYDDTASGPLGAWPAATNICTVEYAQLNGSNLPATKDVDGRWGYLQVWDPAFPAHAIAGVGSGTTEIVGPSDGTTDGLTTGVGKSVYRGVFTAPYDGLYIMYVAADNTFKAFCDGAPQASGGSGGNPLTSAFESTTVYPLTLSAGSHTLAFEVENYPPFGAPNPTGLSVAVYVPGYPPTLVFESTSSSLKVQEYVSELPGMTVGQVLRLMTAEQSARTWASAITLDFSDTLDSAGNAWSDETNIAVTVGQDDCLTVIGKIQTAYADVYMDPSSWTLHAYNWGALNPSSGVTLTAGSNITQLVHKREAISATELLVRSDALGWSTVGSGETQGYVTFGVEVASTEVSRLANKMIDIYGDVRTEITCAFVPAGSSEVPWVTANFVPGSDVTAPDVDGSPVSERVMALGCSVSGSDENLQVVVTLKDRIQDINERMIEELKV